MLLFDVVICWVGKVLVLNDYLVCVMVYECVGFILCWIGLDEMVVNKLIDGFDNLFVVMVDDFVYLFRLKVEEGFDCFVWDL